MFAVAAIPAIILFIAMFFLTDTPRWLAGKDRWDEAQHVLQRYAGKDADAELRQLHKNLEETQHSSVNAPVLASQRSGTGPRICW